MVIYLGKCTVTRNWLFPSITLLEIRSNDESHCFIVACINHGGLLNTDPAGRTKRSPAAGEGTRSSATRTATCETGAGGTG